MVKIAKTDDIFLKIAVGILTAALCGLFTWIWSAQNKLIVMSADIANLSDKVKALSADTRSDEKQDSQISKHWRLHSWARSAINRIEKQNDMPLSDWPNLDLK